MSWPQVIFMTITLACSLFGLYLAFLRAVRETHTEIITIKKQTNGMQKAMMELAKKEGRREGRAQSEHEHEQQ